jgi:hypothetical protein
MESSTTPASSTPAAAAIKISFAPEPFFIFNSILRQLIKKPLFYIQKTFGFLYIKK